MAEPKFAIAIHPYDLNAILNELKDGEDVFLDAAKYAGDTDVCRIGDQLYIQTTRVPAVTEAGLVFQKTHTPPGLRPFQNTFVLLKKEKLCDRI